MLFLSREFGDVAPFDCFPIQGAHIDAWFWT